MWQGVALMFIASSLLIQMRYQLTYSATMPWVCFFFMKDDDLGTAGDEEVHGEPVAVAGAEGGAA